jgi:hypothetical protein
VSHSAQDDSVKQTTAKNRQRQGQKQIPPLRCGMTSKWAAEWQTEGDAKDKKKSVQRRGQTKATANTEILAAPE